MVTLCQVSKSGCKETLDKEDGEIRSAKKNLVTLCQVSKSGCKETLDKEDGKIRSAKKNFQEVETKN